VAEDDHWALPKYELPPLAAGLALAGASTPVPWRKFWRILHEDFGHSITEALQNLRNSQVLLMIRNHLSLVTTSTNCEQMALR
jgi:hypothetical protein